jgi:hypothetical protein
MNMKLAELCREAGLAPLAEMLDQHLACAFASLIGAPAVLIA